MKPLRDSQLHATAYHEAGHAVIAQQLGYKPRAATIIPTRDAHGMVLHANPLRGIQLEVDSSYRARMRIERAIKICFAGPLAQQRYRPSSWRRHHGESDFERAADLALQVCGSGVQATAFLKWLEVTTREMVETRWTHIERVAARLLEVGSLNRNELLAAITLFGDGAVESNSVPRRHPMSPR